VHVAVPRRHRFGTLRLWLWQAAAPLATAPSRSGTCTPPPPLLLPHLSSCAPCHPSSQQPAAHQVLVSSHGWCGCVCSLGPLPSSWGALVKLKGCRLFTNNLCGPLPGSWSGMAALEDLQLATNALTGGSGRTQGRRRGSVWPSCCSRQAQYALVGFGTRQGGSRSSEFHPATGTEEWGGHTT
jgi:hypothetical protein